MPHTVRNRVKTGADILYHFHYDLYMTHLSAAVPHWEVSLADARALLALIDNGDFTDEITFTRQSTVTRFYRTCLQRASAFGSPTSGSQVDKMYTGQ
jgi:hypothetical protein